MGLDGVLEQAEGMIRTNSESCEVQRYDLGSYNL